MLVNNCRDLVRQVSGGSGCGVRRLSRCESEVQGDGYASLHLQGPGATSGVGGVGGKGFGLVEV